MRSFSALFWIVRIVYAIIGVFLMPLSLFLFFHGGWFIMIAYLCGWLVLRDTHQGLRVVRKSGNKRVSTGAEYIMSTYTMRPTHGPFRSHVALPYPNGTPAYAPVRVCPNCRARFYMGDHCQFCKTPLGPLESI